MLCILLVFVLQHKLDNQSNRYHSQHLYHILFIHIIINNHYKIIIIEQPIPMRPQSVVVFLSTNININNSSSSSRYISNSSKHIM